MLEGSFMINDVRGIPEAVQSVVDEASSIEALSEKTCEKGVRNFFFIGCGSSYYAALFGAWPLICSGIRAYALPSSEFLLYYGGIVDEETAVIGVSRSGKTGETVSALRMAKEKRAFTLSFTTNLKSELSRESNERFFVDVSEKSIIMTKSFVTLSLATIIFSAGVNRILSKKKSRFLKDLSRLSYSSEEILKRESLLRELAYARVKDNVERYVFLSSGPGYPIALEGALKVKETSYAASEAFHTLEFRHGPISTVGEKQTIFFIACDGESLTASRKLYSEMLERGADIIALTNARGGFDKPISIPHVESEEAASLLSIVPIQMFSYHYSIGRGRDPDRPRNLSRYIARF